MSSKSMPIKKIASEHDAHETKHHTAHRKESPVWKFSTLILAVLLIASIFTYGFNFNSVKTAENSLKLVLAKEQSQDVKTSINDALVSLEKAKTLIAQEKAAAGTYNGKKVKLDFYVMSQCPYGTQVEDAVKPALDKLGNAVDFSVNFIASDNGDGTYRSLHGENEVLGDIVQLCAAKYNPGKYMDMIVCMNKNAGSIPQNWESCSNDNKLDTAKIKACNDGAEGKALLSDSIKKSTAIGASGSPTMYLDGVAYNSGRDTLSFMRALCSKLDNHPECAKMPVCAADTDCTANADKIGKCTNPNTDSAKCEYVDASPVNLIVINDKRCIDCQNYNSLSTQLKAIFRGLKVTNLDYNDPEGKKLFTELNLKVLPVFLFDDTVKNGEGYANVQNYLEAAGTYTSLRIGASFDPLAEICDNKLDDNSNGKVDCEDSECTGNMACREEKKQQLQVFIMSDCPYGKLAVKALKEVKDNFGDKLSFEVHYIANDNGDGTFESLHGAYEAEEDIRQLCVKKYSPVQWFDYIYCRSVNGVNGIDWKTCAATANVDTAKVETCSSGDEGKALMSEDIKLAQQLAITGSPTWLANNRYTFGGIAAEPVKAEFCKYNVGVAGCEKTLSGDTTQPAGNCG